MKAKILLTGLVAPMVFAACTQEEAFVPQQEAGKIDLSNRPTLGKVTLGFGNQTRATLNDEGYFNSLKWTDTDAVGARLIDSPDDDFGKNFVNPIWQYTVGDISFTNYKYEKGAGTQWVTDALMVEGNYMFYAPYDGKALYRDPLKMKFPVAQTIDTEAELMEGANTSAIKEFFEDETTTTVVGYKFLSSKGQEGTISPEITHLHAYPQITLKNSYFKDADKDGVFDEGKDEYQDITIKQIVIANNQFKENLVIDQPELKKALQDYVAKVQNQRGYENNPEQPAGSWTNDVNFLKNARTSNITNPGVVSSKDGKIVITFEPALEIAAKGEFKFHAVLPAESFAADALQFTVIMPGEDRDQTFADGVDTKTFKNAVALTYSPGKRYAKEEYNFEEGLGNGKGYEVKESAGTLFTIDINGSATKDYVAPVNDIDVLTGTGEDVNSLEKFLQELNNNDRPVVEGTDFTFATYTEGDNNGYSKVVFNKAMVDILNKYLNGANGKISFKTPMLISDELKGSYAINEKYTFKGGVKQIDTKEIAINTTIENKAIFAGKVNLGGTVNGDATFDGEATVNATITGNATFNAKAASVKGSIEGDATFATDANLYGTINKKAYFNGGTSTVWGIAKEGAEVNNATVTIKDEKIGGIQYTSSLGEVVVYNDGTLKLGKDYTSAVAVGKEVKEGNNNVWKAGRLEINADQTNATITLSEGTVTNNNKIKAITLNWNRNTGKLINNGQINADITVQAGASYEHGAAAEVKSLTVNAATQSKDAGYVKNSGELVADNDGLIEVAEETAYTTVTGEGNVNNTKLGVVYNKESNTVFYNAPAFKNSEVFEKIAGVTQNAINKIVVTELWTVNEATNVPATFTNIEFKSDLKVTDVKLTFAPTTEVNLAANSTWTGRTIEKSVVDGMKAINENGYALTTKYLALGGDYYANALANGGTLKLTSDIPLSSVKDITKDLTIDLNNNTISTSIVKALTVKNGVTLTIKNGTMTSSSEGADAGKIIRVEGDNATVILDNVTINSDNAVHVFSGENVNVTIKNCTITAKYNAAVVTNGNSGNEANVTIEGSTITCLDDANNGVAVYAPAAGNLTIKNSILKGFASGVCYRGHGTLKIEGGTFESTATAFTVAPNASGTTAVGAAIVVSPYAPNDAVVNISDVTLKSTTKVGFWEGSIMPGSKNRNTIQKLTWDEEESTDDIQLFKGATSADMDGTEITKFIQ